MYNPLSPKRLLGIFKEITVEPVYLMFAISQGLYAIVSAELYISKVCKVNLAFGDEICDNIQQHKELQVEVQQYASTLKIYNTILQCFPMAICTLFAGPWSDINGRKWLMVSSLFGYVFNNAVFMINTYWFYELKAEYLLFECLQDCTGGFACFLVAVNAYIADITTEKNRTKRMTFLGGLWPIGYNIGKGLSGVIKERLGFMYNFAFGMSLSLVAMVYVLIFIKDSIQVREKRIQREKTDLKTEKHVTREKQDENGNDQESTVSNSQELTDKKSNKFKSFFDLNNIKQGFKVLFAKRDHNMRLFLIITIVCLQVEMFTSMGRWSVQYLYLRRQFNFTMTDYTQYTMVIGIIGIIAQYVTVPILSGKFKLRDSTIVMIDMTGCFIQAVIIACTSAQWMLYVGAVIAFLDYSSNTMLRCMISKSVRPDEVGKIFAVAGAFQAFIPIFAGPVFLLIYKATLEILPQTFIIVVAVFFVINFLLLFIVDRGLKKVGKAKEDLANQQQCQDNIEKQPKPNLSL